MRKNNTFGKPQFRSNTGSNGPNSIHTNGEPKKFTIGEKVTRSLQPAKKQIVSSYFFCKEKSIHPHQKIAYGAAKKYFTNPFQFPIASNRYGAVITWNFFCSSAFNRDRI